jgi:hypothetical protein
MFLLDQPTPIKPAVQRRRFQRTEIQCRARILIGTRHYAGYLHNISRGGAKLRTISSIRKLGSVMLRLPDLPPLRCSLRWSDSYHAGVMFELPLSQMDFRQWVTTRAGMVQFDLDLAEVSELFD